MLPQENFEMYSFSGCFWRLIKCTCVRLRHSSPDILFRQQKLMNRICIHALETQNSLVDEDWTAHLDLRLRLPVWYGMTLTLLACETPPSSYEAAAVRVGRIVNSNTRMRTPRACIGGSIEV